MELGDIDLSDPGNFVDGVPYDWFAYLRREAPGALAPGPGGVRRRASGRSPATTTASAVNRDYEHFSSCRAATLFHDFDEEIARAAAA